MSIPTQIGVNGQGSPIYRFDAIPNKANPGPSLNAADFAQSGDGGDFSAAVTRALTAAGNGGGGSVILPPYPVTFQNPAIGNADNLELIGFGWNSQIVAGTSFPSGSPLIQIQAPASGYRYGIRLAHLFLNGSSVAGVSGIQLTSTYHALLDHVRVRYCAGNGVLCDGSGSQFGAYTTLRKCVISDGVGASANGVYVNNYHEYVTLDDCNIGWYSTAGAVGVNVNNSDNWRIQNCVFDHNDIAAWISFTTNSRITGCEFDRALTTFIRLTGTVNCVVEGNMFQDYVGVSGSPYMISVDGNSSNYRNLIRRNRADHSHVGHWGTGAFAHEGTASGATPNVYEGNQTEGLPITGNASAVPTIRNNVGVNPVGKTAVQPAVPASGTAYTNATGYDCTVYLTGGTFTGNHQIGGQSIGNSTATVLRVAAGQSITLTYSAAPTWLWIGD